MNKYKVTISQNLLVTAYVETDDIEDSINNLHANFNWAEFEGQGFNGLDIDYEELEEKELEDFEQGPDIDEFINKAY